MSNKCPKCGEDFYKIETTHTILIPSNITVEGINPMGFKEDNFLAVYPLCQLGFCYSCGISQREFEYENQEYWVMQPYNLKHLHNIDI